LKAGLAALAIAGAVVAASAPAEAGRRTGTWQNGMVAGPYGPGYYGPDGSFYGNGYGGGHYGYGGGHYGYGKEWGHRGGYRRAYADEPDCYTVTRRVADDWGRVFVRQKRVCE
jgi:hypothetical protein